MNTKKYRTRSEIIARNNGKLNGIWDTSIDIGYSGVKLFSPNKYGCFPTYATRIDEEIQYLSGAPETSIMYRNNKTKELWLVGEFAQNQMMNTSSDDNERTMYGRDRYEKDMFHVVSATGLGIALMDNEICASKTDRLIVQSGLPESYLADTPMFKDSLAGDYDFSLKIGDRPWKDYGFTLPEKDIYVMSQPQGTLFSACIKNDGSMHPDINKYLSGNVIIFDPGFGTFDIFIVRNGAVIKGDTTQNMGMRRVFHDTVNTIKSKYGVDIPVPALQKYLETGSVRTIDRKTLKAAEYDFGCHLFDASEKVCDEAIARMFEAIGGVEQILDYSHLILAGGTGDAWQNHIRERFKDIPSLNIIMGNQNDTELPLIYSNARGYKLYRFNKLLKEMGAQAKTA